MTCLDSITTRDSFKQEETGVLSLSEKEGYGESWMSVPTTTYESGSTINPVLYFQKGTMSTSSHTTSNETRCDLFNRNGSPQTKTTIVEEKVKVFTSSIVWYPQMINRKKTKNVWNQKTPKQTKK